MSVPNQPLPVIVILNSNIITNIAAFKLPFKIFPDKSKFLWYTALHDLTLFCAYFTVMFSRPLNYSILLGLTCLIFGKLLSHVLFCAVTISTKMRIPQYSCFSINPVYMIPFCRWHPVVLLNSMETNSFMFQSNTTIYVLFLFSPWQHIWFSWPSSGHLYKS